MQNLDLEKAVLNTVIYFDIFDCPLTLSELHQWLFQYKIEKDDLKKILEQSEILKSKIDRKDNVLKKCHSERSEKSRFIPSRSLSGDQDDNKEKCPSHNSKKNYFLKGREEIVKIRKERERIAQNKIKKAKKVCKWLLFINPFVKGIAICNDLGYFNAPEESDIDLFIIAQKNRIWMTRFFLILPLKLFGLRPTLKNKKDKICVHFFITEDNLNLENILLKEKGGIPDIHFIYWLTQFLPLYGDDNIWQKFYEANSWLKKFLPNFIPHQFFRGKIGGGKKFLRILHSYFINGFSEKFYRRLQLKILPNHLKESGNQSTDVIINEKMLKFHNPDKREFYRKKFMDKRVLTN